MGGLALSTAVPAAPGSLGTYEFVGTTILIGLGVPSEPALAIVVLVHVMATLPPAVVGLVMSWTLHLGPGRLAAASLEAERFAVD